MTGFELMLSDKRTGQLFRGNFPVKREAVPATGIRGVGRKKYRGFIWTEVTDTDHGT